MTRRLILVRHGVTDWNREGRFQGHADPPLSETGDDEARLLAERLVADSALRPSSVVTSPLARASATARAIASRASVPLTEDRRLIEVGQGEWEGRTHAELARDDAERYAAWRRDGGRRGPPGGEPLDEVVARLVAAVEDLGAGDGDPVCVVSHGGALRLVLRVLLDLSPERAWALDLDNASVSVVGRAAEAGWRLERWNDARHLLGRTRVHVDEAEGRPLAL